MQTFETRFLYANLNHKYPQLFQTIQINFRNDRLRLQGRQRDGDEDRVVHSMVHLPDGRCQGRADLVDSSYLSRTTWKTFLGAQELGTGVLESMVGLGRCSNSVGTQRVPNLQYSYS